MRQQQAQGTLNGSGRVAECHHQRRLTSRGLSSWRIAAAESSRKEAAMEAAMEHGSPKVARSHLASQHQCLCWWRAWRVAQASFSPWPDPNARAFVPLEGPITRTRAAVIRDVDAAPTTQVQCEPAPAVQADPKNRSEERWHSWMADYERMEDPSVCEGCGLTARLWICDCGARLCCGHCMGLCSTCGGELP